MFFACGIWRVADVSSVSPSSEQSAVFVEAVSLLRRRAKVPCKRTQHVGATSPNIVGIVLADVGFRVFKRSQHVGQCCFYGNTLGSLGLIFTQNSWLNCNVVTFVPPLWRSMNADNGKRENASLLHLFSAILKILPLS